MIQAGWLIHAVGQLHNTLALHKKPNGTKEYPASSCCNLIKNYPDVESGMSLLGGWGGENVTISATRSILD